MPPNQRTGGITKHIVSCIYFNSNQRAYLTFSKHDLNRVATERHDVQIHKNASEPHTLPLETVFDKNVVSRVQRPFNHLHRATLQQETDINSSNVVVVVAYAFKSHNWSAKQRHHRLQSVVWTSHHVVLSVGRIRQYVTSFGSHRMNTGRNLWVAISSYRHRSDLVWCGSGSGETTVVEGEQNPAVLITTVNNKNAFLTTSNREAV